nr:MAG: hypothetical protein [Microvirus sp.]
MLFFGKGGDFLRVFIAKSCHMLLPDILIRVADALEVSCTDVVILSYKHTKYYHDRKTLHRRGYTESALSKFAYRYF